MFRLLLGLILAVQMTVTPAQTSVSPMSTASVVLSVIRIALNLGNGRQDYIQVDVIGEGVTPEQARNDGFRLAVDRAVGSVIATQTETQNQRLVRNEIVNYSSGFVDRFDIVDQQLVGNRYRVSMRVWVGENRIAHRLLARSYDSQQVPGAQLSAQSSSIVNERSRGDQLVLAVLADFPARSFDIDIDPIQFNVNVYRQSVAEIPITIQWNKKFLSALHETLNRTQDHAVKTGLVYYTMIQHDPVLQVSAVDSAGRTLARQCFVIPFSQNSEGYIRPKSYMLNLYNDRVWLDPQKFKFKPKLNFYQNFANLEETVKIQATIVSQSKC